MVIRFKIFLVDRLSAEADSESLREQLEEALAEEERTVEEEAALRQLRETQTGAVVGGGDGEGNLDGGELDLASGGPSPSEDEVFGDLDHLAESGGPAMIGDHHLTAEQRRVLMEDSEMLAKGEVAAADLREKGYDFKRGKIEDDDEEDYSVETDAPAGQELPGQSGGYQDVEVSQQKNAAEEAAPSPQRDAAGEKAAAYRDAQERRMKRTHSQPDHGTRDRAGVGSITERPNYGPQYGDPIWEEEEERFGPLMPMLYYKVKHLGLWGNKAP